MNTSIDTMSIIKVDKMKNETVRFKDEWDRESICKYIENRNEPVMILELY